jgi:uncharacterized Zn ribbon protein
MAEESKDLKQCKHCGGWCEHDIYETRIGLLCGDCRYEWRHNKTPPRKARSIVSHEPVSELRYNGTRLY